MSLPTAADAQRYLAILDRELSKYPIVVRLEQQVGVQKNYIALGLTAVYTLLLFLNTGLSPLLANLIGFALPAFYSVKAIESTGTADDTRLLTYWVVFGGLSVLEFWSKTILYFIPFYYLTKSIFLLWLVLPQFSGAEYVYRTFLRGYVRKYVVNVKPAATATGARTAQATTTGFSTM
ncbi:ER membrane protein DP1/Yop1 [Saitoella coloradoensis]